MAEAQEEMKEDVQEDVQEEISSEERARVLGWRPKEEFSGPEERWVDAQTFIKNGEQHAAVAIENNKRLMDEVAQLKRRMDVKEKEFQDRLKRETERVRADYEKQREDAVREGDIERFKEIDRKLNSYNEPQVDYETQSAIDEFKSQNEWYNSKRSMRVFAEAESNVVAMEMPHLNPRAHLKEIERRVEQEFPEYFNKPNGSPVMPGRTGVPSAVSSRRAKTFESMPREARTAAESFMRKASLHGEDAKNYKEDFAKEYWGTLND